MRTPFKNTRAALAGDAPAWPFERGVCLYSRVQCKGIIEVSATFMPLFRFFQST